MMRNRNTGAQVALNLAFVLVSLSFILPLILVVSVSFTEERAVLAGGFGLWPTRFTTAAYELVFLKPQSVINAYIVTFSQAALGTVSSMIVGGMIGYAISRSNFRLKKQITWFVFFTMLFGGGSIPTYIIFTKIYQLRNSFWVYILPGITGGAWNILIYRTFFRSLPESLFEAGKLDGASELRIFFTIVVPLSTPVFATIGFMALIGRWNDYYTALIYIRDSSLYTLQYMLQLILSRTEMLKELAKSNITGTENVLDEAPLETLRYAMCVIAAGPMLFVFPFFQKYFEKGLIIGSVKG